MYILCTVGWVRVMKSSGKRNPVSLCITSPPSLAAFRSRKYVVSRRGYDSSCRDESVQ